MPSSLLLLILFAVVILGVVIAVKVGKRRDVQRQEALAGIATQLGMSF